MISAVVLSYNRCNEVLTTLSYLKEMAKDVPLKEIIVIDNESVDNTSVEIKRLHPDVKLIIKQKNNGIAGWNDGFAVATQKYLLVLDDDSHPESGLNEAINYMEEHLDTGILALNITSGPYLTDQWIWKDGKPWQHEQEILGFFGCGAIIRKSVYDTIGGFADWITVYGHEWEYGLRCIDAGYKIRYFKHSSVNHRASAVNRSLKRARIFGTRNDMAIVYKHFGHDRWIYILRIFINNFKRIRNEGILSVYYDLQGAFKFMIFRKTLTQTPVNAQAQKFFSDNYMNTNPIFSFLCKAIKRQKRN